MIARFTADGTRVPLDVGHATVGNHAMPAFGWIEESQPRRDALPEDSSKLAKIAAAAKPPIDLKAVFDQVDALTS